MVYRQRSSHSCCLFSSGVKNIKGFLNKLVHWIQRISNSTVWSWIAGVSRKMTVNCVFHVQQWNKVPAYLPASRLSKSIECIKLACAQVCCLFCSIAYLAPCKKLFFCFYQLTITYLDRRQHAFHYQAACISNYSDRGWDVHAHSIDQRMSVI